MTGFEWTMDDKAGFRQDDRLLNICIVIPGLTRNLVRMPPEILKRVQDDMGGACHSGPDPESRAESP